MSSVHEAIVHPAVRVILEKGARNWSAYAPSVPGCIAVGDSRAEAQRNIEEALSAHLDDLHDQEVRAEAAVAAAGASPQ